MWLLKSAPARISLLLILVAGLLAGALQLQRQIMPPQRISAFGQYTGYAAELYDGTTRSSNYLALSDGTRLAYDLILPTRGGRVSDQPLPTLFQYTPYLRTFKVFDESGKDLVSDLMNFSWDMRAMLRVRSWLSPDGKVIDPLFRTDWLEPMVKRGYAILVVEQPGTGASFGAQDIAFDHAAREGNDILNWIAAQAWSDGQVGMFGESWEAHNELAVASTNNPHLKAIVPVAVSMDTYDALVYRGGAYNRGFMSTYGESTAALEPMIMPVDGDDGNLLAQALAQRHGASLSEAPKGMRDYPFRDSATPDGKIFWDGGALYPMVDGVNQSGVAVYLTTGWYDVFSADTLKWYDALTVPKRLLVRPLDHSQLGTSQNDVDFAAEVQRWFDYWLKGVDNGIMAEPPIHYYLIGAQKNAAWQTADSWPLSQQPITRLYLADGRTGTVASANDGSLQPKASSESGLRDVYLADPTTTTGKRARWSSVERAHEYPDMRPNDAKALTYTTEPLPAPTQLVGHPVLHVWLSSTATDADVFAYLEEVDRNGASTYVTEGNLRASHRALSPAPFDNLGLPYHSGVRADLAVVPPESQVELNFDLLPTAYQFGEGNRIRLTVAFADADNFESPILDPPPTHTIWRDADHASYMELPMVQ